MNSYKTKLNNQSILSLKVLVKLWSMLNREQHMLIQILMNLLHQLKDFQRTNGNKDCKSKKSMIIMSKKSKHWL